MRRYIFQAGGYESPSFYRETDGAAERVVDRWLRLFWRRYVNHVSRRYPGSMAAATAEGWGAPPTVTLWSWTLDDAWIASCAATRVFEDRPITQHQLEERGPAT